MTKVFKLSVIDDSDLNNLLIQSMYANKPEVHVEIHKTGHDGIKAMKKNLPDLILLDIMLPDQDGFSILNLLKKDEKLSHIPVIVVSSIDNDSEVQKAKDMGAVDFVKKPIGLNKLYDKINKHLIK